MTTTDTIPAAPSRRGPGALLLAVLVGGGIAGVLDITYACVVSAVRSGVAPTRVFKYVASGLLGPGALEGGAVIAALGLGLHFGMALLIAAIFVLASLALPTLRARPILWGLLYGAGVYFVMNFVVVPLSLAPMGSPPLYLRAAELVDHMLVVGLPIALAARWKLGKAQGGASLRNPP